MRFSDMVGSTESTELARRLSPEAANELGAIT